MNHDPLQNLLGRLQDVNQHGDRFSARCPAHADSTPSLSISCGEAGKVLVRCHAGCTAEQICGSLGIKLGDLFPKEERRSQKNWGTIVARYDYCDESGNLLYQTVRFEPKDFRQRQPIAGGKWKWNLKDVRRLLYRLPQLIAAPHDEWIFVVEGEKDADNLVANGLTATTCPMGAGKWKHVDDSALAGRRVVILPDKDATGCKHAADVARRLVGRAAEVRILELPGDGKDASDWLEAGGTREGLFKLVESTPACDPQADQRVSDDADAESEELKSSEISRSQATKLVDLTADTLLFFDDEDAYVSFANPAGGRETLPIRSKKFKQYLSRKYYLEHQSAPSSQAMSDAISTIEGKAFFEGPEHKVHVRLAEHEGAIYLDLADAQRRVIEVTRSGWQVLQNPPVFFRRPKGLLPLPAPARGGSLQQLSEFINVKEPSDLILLISWLVGLMRPGWPTPVLALSSEQGSGKSTTTRLLRMVIDPNRALIRCSPREPRDLMIAANNAWVIALDNLSQIPDWLSDALCRLSTGGGFSTRKLYENDEEQLFDSLRPVILNGIEELGSRSDLLERSIRVSLPGIPEERRRPEAEIYRRFNAAHPSILGALLDAVSHGLRRIDSIQLDRLPRMADFAMWNVAAEPAMPWDQGEFLAAYTENRDAAHSLAMDATPIGDAILAFAEQHPAWSGKASDLLKLLNQSTDEHLRLQPKWPKVPHGLSSALRRLAPNFRALGVLIEFPDRTRKGRSPTIRKVAHNSVTSVTERHEPLSDVLNGVARDADHAKRDAGVTLERDADHAAVTQCDAGDAHLRCSSTTVQDEEREVAEL